MGFMAIVNLVSILLLGKWVLRRRTTARRSARPWQGPGVPRGCHRGMPTECCTCPRCRTSARSPSSIPGRSPRSANVGLKQCWRPPEVAGAEARRPRRRLLAPGGLAAFPPCACGFAASLLPSVRMLVMEGRKTHEGIFSETNDHASKRVLLCRKGVTKCPVPVAETGGRIREIGVRIEPHIVRMRRRFHQHPDAAMQAWTADAVCAELDSLGVPWRRVAGNGVIATIVGTAPVSPLPR